MDGTQATMMLMVTCSLDETRRDLAVKVTENLADLVISANLDHRFVIFDNASKYNDHLVHAPDGATICRCDRNVGYWTAIKWVLENRQQLVRGDVRYLYIVESDLWHRALRPLGECEAFLEENRDCSSVRTQEFSVRNRWRYDKGLRYMPFRKMRSIVTLRDLALDAKAWFTLASGNIWRSNLHAKLPALNRLDLMDSVFAELATLDEFTETDFFKLMRRRKPHVGVLDGGLWYQLSTPQTKNVVSGSWSDPAKLAAVGYKGTRKASIDRGPFDVRIEKVGAHSMSDYSSGVTVSR